MVAEIASFLAATCAGHGKERIEAFPGDRQIAELALASRDMLAVIEEEAPALEMAIKRGEADLGGISRERKVALGEEHLADGEAENASDQRA